MSVDFEVSICDTFKPRRYYIVLSLSNTGTSMPNVNRHAWFEIKYDSVATQLVDSKFDYFSNANKITEFSYDNLLINGGFETNLGWSNLGTYYSLYQLSSEARSGSYSARAQGGSGWVLYNDTFTSEQEVDLSPFNSNIVLGKANLDFSGFIKSIKTATQVDDGQFIIEYKNASGSIIQTEKSGWISDTSWYNYTFNKVIPTAAKSVNVKLYGRQRSGNTGYNNFYDRVDVFFDDVVLKVIVQDSSLLKIRSKQIYIGEADYFKNAGIDATDSAFSSNNSFCADAKSTWYKITVDSVGYIYYNYKYTNYGAYGDLRELTTYNNELYREVSAGDSINGLVHVPYIAGSNAYPSLGYAVYAWVSPGTYYIRIIGCNFICNDYAYPQMLFDFHTGDFCETAIPLVIDTLELVKDRALVNCHTMGTDFGEDGSNLGCLYGPNGYKSSWFVVNYEDTAKVDLEFKMAEYTDAKPSDIRYRTYYGNCQSLTPAPCNNNALTSFVLDCVRKGTYYVQIVTPENATGEVEMSVEAKKNTDSTCNPIDIFKPNAAFYYNTNCPENVVEFINTSSRGDSIRYFRDFGYNNLTDTILNPVLTYPPDNKENTYTVKLIVEHITRGSIDSISLPVVVPFAPEVKIITNDTIICSGDSITLNAYISNGNGFWSTGDSSTSIVVNTTGYYYFDMQEKPQLLEASSFEQSNFLNYWTSTGNNWVRTSGYSPIDSSYIVYPTYGSATAVGIAELYQDYDISFDSIEIDSGISKLSVTGYTRGHLSYATDESQIIVEYYSGSNTLLAQNATGLNKLSNDWDFLNHTRTTPKGTRKVRVRLQVNKTNTTYTYAFAFFDKIQLKMRSSCSYLDSVYVQVNQNPSVALPNDTFFCKGDSFLLKPETNYISPYLVNESFRNSVSGTLIGSAAYKTGGYVQLTPAQQYTDGQLEWVDSSMKLSQHLTIAYDLFVGENGYPDYYTNYVYLFNSNTPTSFSAASGGYKIAFSGDGTGNNWIRIYFNSTKIYDVKIGQDFVGKGWKRVKVIYNNGKFEIYIDNKFLTSYTDTTTRTLAGYKYGLGSNRYSWTYAEVNVKNFSVALDNPYTPIVPAINQFAFTWNDSYTDSVRWVTNSSSYTLRITDNYGCKSNSDTVDVSAVFQYDSLFVQEDRVCNSLDSFQLTVPNSAGYFYNSRGVDSLGLLNVDSAVFGNNPLYFAVIDSFGCLMKDTGEFILDTMPNVVIANISSLCKNDSAIQLMVNNSDGYFYGGSYVDSSGLFDPSLTTLNLSKVYYQTFNNGCIGKDSIEIRVDTVPNASISAAGPFCQNAGNQSIGTNNSLGSFTTTSYINSSGSFYPALATVGNNIVYFSVTDGNGCSSSDSAIIRIDSIPDASISAAGPFCENGGLQTLSGAVNTGGLFTTTSFLDSAGIFNPAIAQSGTHNVYYTIVDGNGCSNTDSSIIAVDTIPNANIAAAGPFCENGGLQLVTPQSNTGGWFKNTAYLDSTGNFNPALAQAGIHKIYYNITDGNGCGNTDSLTIVVDSIPDASIISSGPFCENGGLQTLSGAVNTNGLFTPTIYLDSAGIFNPAIAQSGTHNVYYTFVDGNGCSNTDSVTIVVDSIPDASISAAGPFCENGGLQTLSGATNTGGLFTTTSYLDSTGSFNPAIAKTGTHEIYYTFMDGNGCTNSDSTTIVVDSIPDASITAAGPFCENAGLQSLSAVVNTSGWFTNTSYLDSAGSFNPSVAQAGSHTIFYNFTDGNGCSNIDSANIIVNPIPDADILAVGPLCKNDADIELITNSTGGIFIGSSYLTSTGTFSPQDATVGNNKVVHTITNSFGCTSSDSISIEVYAIPNNNLDLNPAKGCEVLIVNFATQPADSIRWNINGSIRINETTFTDSFTNGIYNVSLEVLNGNGCKISLDSFVEVYPNPTASFDYTPKDIYISDPEVFFEDKSLGNVVGWDWDFGDNNSSSQQNPSNTFNIGGTYKVVLFVEDENGCMDSVSQNVLVKDELLIFIPNAFSPNNDGLNDVFRITGLGFDNIKMSIYSRWGEKIYESNDFKEWNGIYKGADVQTGVYLYMMTITDSKGWKSYRSGEIHLVR